MWARAVEFMVGLLVAVIPESDGAPDLNSGKR